MAHSVWRRPAALGRTLRLATVSASLAALSCIAVAGTTPTAVHAATSAATTLTLHLVGGGLDLQMESISTLSSGEGSTVYDAVLEVDDATGSGAGWLITADGTPQALQVLAAQAGCLAPSNCVPARAGSPADGDTSHLLFAAQPDSGMGRQRLEVVFRTAAPASGDQWCLSVTPRV